MDEVLDSIQAHIKSGDYFIDARRWYNFRYLYPTVQRSGIFLLFVIFTLVCITVALNIQSMLPLASQVKYALVSTHVDKTTATVTHATGIAKNPLASISDIIVKNYVVRRESYNYNLMQDQFTFIQKNSTRIVFKQFSNFMNIDNALSPVMRYQKSYQRSIEIISAKYPSANEAIVTFHSIAQNSAREVIEDMIWQAHLNFDIDQINISAPNNSRFNFAVTDYKLKLINNNK